ncbi:MAG TPA: hypothetical protein VFS12_14460, partial [Terriglobia bacterium]|nr:hypothetical protein [Terriglobia bacterium]
MRKWMIIILALASSGKVSGQEARGASSDAQARDLSNMFYTDTLPPKAEAKAETKKPVVKKAAPRKPVAATV